MSSAVMSTAVMSTAVVDIVPGALAAPRGAARPAGHLRVVAPDERRPRGAALRITRRGRLAVTATLALALVLALASLLSSLAPAGATSAVVVQPGMTLNQIAAEQLPGVPLDQAVVDIQRANRLSTTEIAAGQELVIPGR